MAVNPIQTQKFLSGIDYPCTRDELVSYAAGHGADDDVLGTLRSMPDGQYQTPKDVSRAIGGEE